MIRFGSFLLFAGGFVALVAALSLGCASSFGGDPGEADCTEANLDSDPNNCGACGRTCVIPNASASCNLGECTVGICETGFTDDDGQLDNGCEADDETVVDNSCTTTCGSTGTTDPNDDQTCVAPAEECNGLDDNCDGVCDEDRAGSCRVGMHRSFGNGHLFTTDLTAAQTAPFSIEQQNYFYLYAAASVATETVYLCRKADTKHIVTTDSNCEGVGNQLLTLGAWAMAQECGAVPLHRLYHEPTNNHFYTLSAGERDSAVNNLGYVSEGIAGYVWTAL